MRPQCWNMPIANILVVDFLFVKVYAMPQENYFIIALDRVLKPFYTIYSDKQLWSIAEKSGFWLVIRYYNGMASITIFIWRVAVSKSQYLYDNKIALVCSFTCILACARLLIISQVTWECLDCVYFYFSHYLSFNLLACVVVYYVELEIREWTELIAPSQCRRAVPLSSRRCISSSLLNLIRFVGVIH